MSDQLGIFPLADPFDFHQLFRIRKAAVRLAVGDDPLRQLRADPLQRHQAGKIRRVDVHRHTLIFADGHPAALRGDAIHCIAVVPRHAKIQHDHCRRKQRRQHDHPLFSSRKLPHRRTSLNCHLQ